MIASSKYDADADLLLDPDERSRLEFAIACDPLVHPLIPGAGGARKARWARPGTGKRGGVRAIYFYAVSAEIVVMLAIYAKNRKEDLTSAEEKQLRQTIEGFQKELARRKPRAGDA